MKSLPRITPLTLKRQTKPFDDPNWVFELKHDGFRGVAYIENKQCRLISRNNNAFKKFPALSEALGKLRVKDAILDGEIVCLEERGNSQFNELFHRRGQPYFYAFDLLWLNGRDLRGIPLLERKERLRNLLMRANNPALLYADHIDEHGVDFFRVICESNLEGIICKHREGTYSKNAKWIKIKNPAYSQREGRGEFFARKDKKRGGRPRE
jgi:bifunctional non-homologous end joining protein LigD